MQDKIILSMDDKKPNQFYVYELEYNKFQVRTSDGRVVGNAASLEQVEGTMKCKFQKYPYILYLHTVDTFDARKPRRTAH